MNLSEPLEFFLRETAGISRFFMLFWKEAFVPPFEFTEIRRQCYKVGNKSLPLVGVTAFIIGVVLTLQSRPTLVKFGAQAWLPAMVSVTLIREVSPVLSALICAGKVGSGIGAELGSMNVTEQIDAMEVSGTRPFKYLVVTRIIATTLMVPLLALFADAISLYGSFVGANINAKVSSALFFRQALNTLEYSDVIPAFVKTFLFGFIIGLVSCYKGYFSFRGTEGVGQAANASVVVASLLIFVIDMLAVQITNIVLSF